MLELCGEDAEHQCRKHRTLVADEGYRQSEDINGDGFVLLFGAALSWKFNDWTSFLIVAGCAGVFMLISCFFFGLAFSASDPQETYEISEVYVKTGYGRSSVYLHFDKVRAVLFTRKYIELWGRNRKMRVYVPTEDSDFVKDFIHSHLPLGCDIRYESNDS